MGIIWPEVEDERQAGRGALNCCLNHIAKRRWMWMREESAGWRDKVRLRRFQGLYEIFKVLLCDDIKMPIITHKGIYSAKHNA